MGSSAPLHFAAAQTSGREVEDDSEDMAEAGLEDYVRFTSLKFWITDSLKMTLNPNKVPISKDSKYREAALN